MDRIKKTSNLDSVLEDSTFFNDVDETATEIPAINIALAGGVTGGMKSGIRSSGQIQDNSHNR